MTNVKVPTPAHRATIAHEAGVPVELLEQALQASNAGTYAEEPWFPFAPGRRADPVKFFPGCLAKAWRTLQKVGAGGSPLYENADAELADVRDYCACFVDRLERGEPFPPPVAFVAPRPLVYPETRPAALSDDPAPVNTPPDVTEPPTGATDAPEAVEPEPTVPVLGGLF